MKITSVKGTNDYLPNEVEIRDYLQERILSVYKEMVLNISLHLQ